MSDTINLFYLKTADGRVWYFDDINRKSIIEQGLLQLYEFVKTRPSRKEFDQHPGIQRILREVPECRASYQRHICESVKFDSHTPVA